ncbi:hypothetical protein SAMN06297387_12855 [Streptomyces zhaozhouensis]|uniref:Uncharacterized protein n=1 Tax=Streptomyces zhaozhouensis TaxID=1300267 RepID=A0A286E874_9ACTN|nr:hypothetical protein [Streptomyces zhaozhouensis]SOD67079.1 hypothetical protein SAMN06297387_12855 [Streptomyces zhaozhouensis]
MDFEYHCWRCWETNVIWGKKVASFWHDKYRLPPDFECWNCGAINDLTDD